MKYTAFTSRNVLPYPGPCFAPVQFLVYKIENVVLIQYTDFGMIGICMDTFIAENC